MRITLLILLFPAFLAAQNDTGMVIVPQLDHADVVALENFEAHKEQTFDSLAFEDPLLFDLDDLIAARTPVFIKQYGNSGIATAGFRGTGAVHTSVLWNGLDVNSPTLGQSDLNTFPLAFSESVDVTYGISSLPQSSGGLGGTISLNDQLHFENRTNAKFRLGMGSFSKMEGMGKISWGSKRWQFETGIFHRQAENDFTFVDPSRADLPTDTMQNADYTISGVSQSVGFKPNDHHTFNFHLNATKAERTIPGILLSPGKYSQQWDENVRGVLEWKHVRQKSIQRIQSGFTFDRLDYQGDEFSNTNSSSWQSQYRGLFLLSEKWKLRTLAQHRIYFAESDGYSSSHRQNRTILSSTIERETKSNRVFLTLREEKIDDVFSPFLFSVGSVQRLFGGVSLKANVGRNYRYPAFNDLYWNPGGNPNLEPEEGWSAEAGLTWERTDDGDRTTFTHQLGVNYYLSLIENWILWSPKENIWQPQNLWKVRNRGVEVNLSEKVESGSWRLNVDLQYSYTSTENIEESAANEGMQLIYVPFHTARAVVNAKWKSWTARVQYAHNGKRYIAADHSSWMPFFSTTDVSLGKEFEIGNDRLSCFFTINNLLDQNYQVMPWRPMPGRNFMVNLVYEFKSGQKR
ncbi:TonB-dependent receptor [Halocola ammonii]